MRGWLTYYWRMMRHLLKIYFGGRAMNNNQEKVCENCGNPILFGKRCGGLNCSLTPKPTPDPKVEQVATSTLGKSASVLEVIASQAAKIASIEKELYQARAEWHEEKKRALES